MIKAVSSHGLAPILSLPAKALGSCRSRLGCGYSRICSEVEWGPIDEEAPVRIVLVADRS
jgi:hypothetical protein